MNHSLDTYSYLNYVAYALYPPLYIAGPIMTFNDFMWQVRVTRASSWDLYLLRRVQLKRPLGVKWRSTFNYLVRFVVCIMTLEFILHCMYVVAIKDTKAWQGTNAAELSMIGFWNLIIVWLKVNWISVSPHMRL